MSCENEEHIEYWIASIEVEVDFAVVVVAAVAGIGSCNLAVVIKKYQKTKRKYTQRRRICKFEYQGPILQRFAINRSIDIKTSAFVMMINLLDWMWLPMVVRPSPVK